MSAWYVLSALGFYSVDPVSGTYVFGTPLFDHAVVDLGSDKHLILEAVRCSPHDLYIQRISLNGRPFERSWFHHREIVNGAHFIFTLGPEPNKAFGADAVNTPPGQNTWKAAT